MIAIRYTTRHGHERYRFDAPPQEYADLAENGGGACVCCGDECDMVEPDARQYRCECCGQDGVYGVEKLLVMGLIRFLGDNEE